MIVGTLLRSDIKLISNAQKHRQQVIHLLLRSFVGKSKIKIYSFFPEVFSVSYLFLLSGWVLEKTELMMVIYPMDFKMHRDGKGANPREHR